MSHVAIVLAAGKGTRMKSELPKVMHPLAGRPMLAWVLDAVAATEPSRTVVVVGHGAEQVVGTLPESVEACVQDEQLGTGHAVQVALDHLGQLPVGTPVMVVPGDTPLIDGPTLTALLDRRLATRSPLVMLSARVDDPTGYGRVVRRDDGSVEGIVEQKDADTRIQAIDEINAGMYVFDSRRLAADLADLTTDNAQGEYYLTDVVAASVARSDQVEAVIVDVDKVGGINDHGQLASAEAMLRRQIVGHWMREGVRMMDPDRTYLDADVVLAAGVTILPGCVLEGATRIEAGATVGPDVYASDSVIGADSHVWYAVLRGAEVGERCEVGPYASLRPGSVLKNGSKVGTFAETKNTTLGEGAKVPHLSYMGDAVVGDRTNIGAGTITCNYDGFAKHKTVIGSDVFIGSDTMLIAPVEVGDGAMTAAGSAITADVEPGAMGIARGRQRNIAGFVEGLAARYRAKPTDGS